MAERRFWNGGVSLLFFSLELVRLQADSLSSSNCIPQLQICIQVKVGDSAGKLSLGPEVAKSISQQGSGICGGTSSCNGHMVMWGPCVQVAAWPCP